MSAFLLSPGPRFGHIQNVSFNKTVNKKVEEICDGKRGQSFYSVVLQCNFLKNFYPAEWHSILHVWLICLRWVCTVSPWYVSALIVRQTCWFQTNEQISSQKAKNSEQEEIYKVKKKTMDLLPDAENNIAKLQVIMKYSYWNKPFSIWSIFIIFVFCFAWPVLTPKQSTKEPSGSLGQSSSWFQ